MRTAELYNEWYKLKRQHKLLGWDMDISWRMRATLGRCYYGKKKIVMSAYHVQNATDEEVMNTLLHEIAHALAEKEGKKGHGRVWRLKCMEIGARPERINKTIDILDLQSYDATGYCGGRLLSVGDKVRLWCCGIEVEGIYRGFMNTARKYPHLIEIIERGYKKKYRFMDSDIVKEA